MNYEMHLPVFLKVHSQIENVQLSFPFVLFASARLSAALFVVLIAS